MINKKKGGFHKGVRLFLYVKRFILFIKSSFYKKRFCRLYSESEYEDQLLKLEDLCISFKLINVNSNIYGLSNGSDTITLNTNACNSPFDTVIHEICHIWKFPLPLGNETDYWSDSEEIRCRLMVILYKMWKENLSPELAYVELFDDLWLIYKREVIVNWLERVV